jgi:hypothetical protein
MGSVIKKANNTRLEGRTNLTQNGITLLKELRVDHGEVARQGILELASFF